MSKREGDVLKGDRDAHGKELKGNWKVLKSDRKELKVMGRRISH